MIKMKIYILLIVLASMCLPLHSQVEIDVSELSDSIMINDSLANYYAKRGDLSNAQKYALINVGINNMLGDNSVPYAVAVLKYARYLYPNERDEDDGLSSKGLSILKDSLGTKSSIYIKYLLEYAWRLYNNNQVQEAYNTIKDVAEEGFNGDEFYLGYLYYSYSHFLKEIEETDLAKTYALKAKFFYEKVQKSDNDYYLKILTDLAFLNIADQGTSISYLNQVKIIVEKNIGKSSVDYLDVLLNFSYIYRYNNQLEKALDYAIKAKDIGEEIKELDNSSYLYTLCYLSEQYSSLKQYDKAIKYAEDCLILMKEDVDISLDNRLSILDSLVVYNKNIPNVEKINLYAKEAYLIRKSLNISGMDLVVNLFYLLHSNYKLGKYEECEANVNEIKALYGDSYSTDYKHYYDDMEVLMHSFLKRKQYKEALDVSNEIKEVYLKQFGEENEYLASIISTQASIYTYLDDYEKCHDYSLKALEILKKKYGELSPQYLSNLTNIANNFYIIGFEDSYSLLKKSACLSYDVYGKMNMMFVQDFFRTMTLWLNYKEDFLDDYKLDDFYHYLQFQRIVCNFNSNKDNIWEKMGPTYELYIKASLPSILQKYDKDSVSIDAIYNSLLFLRTKQPNIDELKTQIKNEINVDGKTDNELDDFCSTNSYYLKSIAAYTNPEIIDSLYKESNQGISDLSKKSSTFQQFINNKITTELLINNLKGDEIVLDYLCLKQMGDGYVDYIVTIDKNKKSPDFIPVSDAPKQIRQICDSYIKTYFIFDNDSILYGLNIDETNSNCTIGYDMSIEQILNRNHENPVVNLGIVKQDKNNFHEDDFNSAYNEFEKGVKKYNQKQYEQAIKSFYLCDSLMYIVKGESSNYYGHGRHWIASCLHKMGNDSIAQEYSQYYYLTPIDMRKTVLSDSILDQADILYYKGNKEEALLKYLEASEIEKYNVGENSYWYANTISHCAEICNEIGEYKRAIEFEKEALRIRKKSPGVNHIDYYWSLKNLFSSYSTLEMNEERYKIGEQIITYMEKHNDLLGNENSFFPIYTSMMAMASIDNNKSQDAYSFFTKSINTTELLKDSPAAYLHMYYNAIMGFKMIGHDSLSFELCKKIIPIYEKQLNMQINPNEFFEILLIAANHYYQQGDFITTSLYQERALEIVKDKSSLIYGTALSNLALTYSELGRFDESISIAQKAVSICDTIPYIDGYAKALSALAHCYSIANKPKDALRCGKEVFNFLAEKKGVDDAMTLIAANNLAMYYDELGYYDEAVQCVLFVFGNAGEDLKKYGEIVGTAYNNLAMKWSTDTASLKYINKAYEIRKDVLGENNIYTIQSLYNKGICLINIGEVVEGVRYINKALNQTKNLIGENNLRYVVMMKILPLIYGRGGDLSRALEIQKEISTMLKRIVGEEHISYIQSLDDLSELYFYTNDTINLYSTVIDESQKYRKKILSDFSNYTSIERTNFINGMSRFFDWLFPLVCYYRPQPTFCSELYNALLLRKGILLNSEIEFSRLIRESGDSSLVRHYKDLILNKNLLNRQYQLPVEQRVFDVDSLRHVINEKEDYLVSASKEYGDYTKRFRTNWKDIRDKLIDGELSVEFVEFYDTCAIQNRLYYALVINKYSDSPELVPLCMEQQIHEVMKSDNPGGLYQLIWNPILQKSKNVNTLFFSPAGILNNIGIEYVDINEYENISDKYAIYRLSSTREIVENQKTACKSAALYGGLDYSVDTDVLLAQNVRSGFGMNSSVIYRGLSDSLVVRNNFEPLYNTKTEISEIDKTLKKGNVVVFMYSDTFGTEESFKALSGKGMNLIHLATHGMYIDASEAESKKRETNLSFIQLDDPGGGQIQEDKSLSRSFLVMSGGDMLPSHKEVPDNLEDGILTASEISKIDLRGLDLVVLSACQTALGDVDNEGVYGLQRGFKKAGANTMLMSLDKVDDEATKILMVEFYKNLMSGKTKHQSLKDAQKYLRQVDNGKYDKPEYWASFIMLDGLN